MFFMTFLCRACVAYDASLDCTVFYEIGKQMLRMSFAVYSSLLRRPWAIPFCPVIHSPQWVCSSHVGKRVEPVLHPGCLRARAMLSDLYTLNACVHLAQPPETLVEGTISRATDIYSLGVLLWAMYTGSRPWAGLSHAQVSNCAQSYRREHACCTGSSAGDVHRLQALGRLAMCTGGADTHQGLQDRQSVGRV